MQGKGSNGGVWEWTSTLFDTHDGLVPTNIFPGYSADFFDGVHHVVVSCSSYKFLSYRSSSFSHSSALHTPLSLASHARQSATSTSTIIPTPGQAPELCTIFKLSFPLLICIVVVHAFLRLLLRSSQCMYVIVSDIVVHIVVYPVNSNQTSAPSSIFKLEWLVYVPPYIRPGL